MSAVAHVVAIRRHGHWSASFVESPEIGIGGTSPLDAVRRLLDGHVRLAADVSRAVEVLANSAADRREFVVPLASRPTAATRLA